MPKFEPKDLEVAIQNGAIRAISLDTSIFDQFGCNLRFNTLTALENYPKVGITVVLTDVVLNEVETHIRSELCAAHDKARAGLNQYGKAWQLDLSSQEIERRLSAPEDADGRASTLVKEYIDRVGATIIAAADYAPATEIVERWKFSAPPFGRKEAKKNEFPDAFSLLALEAWAKARKTRLLVVSRDGDWSAFAAQSDHLVVVNEIKLALDLFNVEDRTLALEIVERLKARGSAPALDTEVERALERYLEDFDSDAWSYYEFEIENGPAMALDWSVADSPEVRVIAADPDSVTIALQLEARVEFEISVELQQRDGVDRDYVSLGYHRFTTQSDFTLPLTLLVYREDLEAFQTVEGEIADRPLHVHFGDLEPDWGYEE